MAATTYTAELSARTANQALAASGVTAITVSLPTNLISLIRMVNKVYEGTQAMQITANLTETVEGIVEWQRENGIEVKALNVPDVMNTAAAAAAAVNVSLDADEFPKGSRARGLAQSRAKIALDAMICRADARGGRSLPWAAWASEGYWQLVRHEPSRVARLIASLEAERHYEVIDALVEYAAKRRGEAARVALDVPTGGPGLAETEAAKDEAAADAEYYGF